MHHSETNAVCRGCGLILRGKPYSQGGSAYHPRTGKECPSNHFGGYVCSQQCDFNACLEQERSMPGHGESQKTLSSYARQAITRNWAA